MPQRRAGALTAEDRARIIRQTEIGGRLDEETLARLAVASAAFDVRRRRFVYRRGDAADAVYLIARGRVKICSIEDDTSREAVIDILGAFRRGGQGEERGRLRERAPAEDIVGGLRGGDGGEPRPV